MKAYKAFDKNLQCRGVQYEVGYVFTEDSPEIIACKAGIHCCPQLKDVYNYYAKSYDTRVCEVEVIGDDFVKDGDKLACREIYIVRELSKEEIKNLTDDLRFNSGNHNSGYRNSGNRNSGNRNSGDYNSGNRNSGNCNSGNYNSGSRNSGYYNSGSWNSTYRETGFFNTKAPKTVNVFNKPCDIDVWDSAMKPDFLYFSLTKYVDDKLVTMEYKEAFQESFKKATKFDIELLKALPNFDADVFYEISGIRIK